MAKRKKPISIGADSHAKALAFARRCGVSLRWFTEMALSQAIAAREPLMDRAVRKATP